MKIPGCQFKFGSLVGAIVFALAGAICAQPPSAAESPASKAPRTKPQRIYQVRPASNYAATLHSQEKRTSNELPVDNTMPSSLQYSRSNANAAAAEAEARARQQPTVKERPPRHPKVQKNRVTRPPMSVKSHGGGKGHGKGHGKGPKH